MDPSASSCPSGLASATPSLGVNALELSGAPGQAQGAPWALPLPLPLPLLPLLLPVLPLLLLAVPLVLLALGLPRPWERVQRALGLGGKRLGSARKVPGPR